MLRRRDDSTIRSCDRCETPYCRVGPQRVLMATHVPDSSRPKAEDSGSPHAVSWGR